MRTSCSVRRTPLLAIKGQRSFASRFPEICLDYLGFFSLLPQPFLPISWHLLTGLAHPGAGIKIVLSWEKLSHSIWMQQQHFQLLRTSFSSCGNEKVNKLGGEGLPWCLGSDFISNSALKSWPRGIQMKGWKGEVTKHWTPIHVQQGFKSLLYAVCPNPETGKNPNPNPEAGGKVISCTLGGWGWTLGEAQGQDALLKPQWLHCHTWKVSRLAGHSHAERIWWRRSCVKPPLDQETHGDTFRPAFWWPFIDNTHIYGLKNADVQKHGTINRGTSADLYWRNHHLNLASRWTLITGKLLRHINFNMGCLLVSKCWDIPQAPAAHPERAARRERPRAASTDCSDLCFSSCPTANPE